MLDDERLPVEWAQLRRVATREQASMAGILEIRMDGENAV
jgi:hypothetical protein